MPVAHVGKLWCSDAALLHCTRPIVPLKYGSGYVIIRSTYTHILSNLRGTINPKPSTLNSSFHFLFHYPYITYNRHNVTQSSWTLNLLVQQEADWQDQSGDLDADEVETLLAAMGLQGPARLRASDLRLRILNPEPYAPYTLSPKA